MPQIDPLIKVILIAQAGLGLCFLFSPIPVAPLLFLDAHEY